VCGKLLANAGAEVVDPVVDLIEQIELLYEAALNSRWKFGIRLFRPAGPCSPREEACYSNRRTLRAE
jgi:hypothetical protein